MLAYAFCMGAALTIFDTAAYSLFLAEFSGDMLPYIYLGGAVIITVVGAILTKFEDKFTLSRWLTLLLLLLLATTVVLVLGIELFNSTWLIFLLLIWGEVAATLIDLAFWGLADRLYDIRQGKRLFGLISSGELTAGMIVGFSIPILVRWLGTTRLLWITAIGFALCFVIFLIILRKFSERLAEEEEEEETDQPTETSTNKFFDLLKNRYIALMFLLSAFTIVGFYFMDFAFFSQIESQYPNEDDLARFLGIFFGVSQGIQLFITTFLAGRFLNRFGLKFGLIGLPLMVTIGTLFLITTQAFIGLAGLIIGILTLIKLIDGILRTTINDPATQLLYQPIPADKQLSLRTLIDAVFSPIFGGLAGLALLLFTLVDALTFIHLLFITFIIFAGWYVVAFLLTREYPAALTQALSKRILEGDALTFIDASSVEVLQSKLDSPRFGDVLYCLDILERFGHESLPQALIAKLDHPLPEIRLDVLKRIERLDITAAVPEIKQRIEREESSDVLAVGLQTLGTLDELEAIDLVAPYTNDPDLQVRQGAIVGVLRGGGIVGILQVGRQLLALTTSSDPSERQLVAQVLGEIGMYQFYQPLLELLQDPDTQVRQAALEAAGKVKNPHLWDLVLENLSLQKHYKTASMALVAGGDSVAPMLKQAFTDPSQPAEVLIRIAWICGRMGGDQATTMLREQIAFHNKDVRYQVLASLSRCGFVAKPEETDDILQIIRDEITDATWILATIVDFSDQDARLTNALKQEISRICERVFLLLRFIYNAATIKKVELHISSSSQKDRAYALELLDTQVSQELKVIFLPLLQDFAPQQALKQLESSFAQPSQSPAEKLNILIAEQDVWTKPWTRACALYAAAELSHVELVDSVGRILSDPSPLVRETAIWALATLAPETAHQYIKDFQHDPSLQVRRVVEHLKE
jgi:HEAT repeat protein